MFLLPLRGFFFCVHVSFFDSDYLTKVLREPYSGFTQFHWNLIQFLFYCSSGHKNLNYSLKAFQKGLNNAIYLIFSTSQKI
jgi:hypothetical protein